MKLHLWKGYHSPELYPLIASVWNRGELMVLCPPFLKDFSFLQAFDEADLSLHGEWSEAESEVLFAMTNAPGSKAATMTVEAMPEIPVLGVFTSGTLSRSPRLALYTKTNVESSLNAIHTLFDLSRIDSLFCYPQAFHTFGLTLGYVACELRGWNLITAPGKYSSRAHALRAACESPNLLTLGTPTHFYDLIQYVRKNELQLKPSYSAIAGGAPVTRELWLQMQSELEIEAPSVGYGCTEASPGVTHLSPGLAPEAAADIGSFLPSIKASVGPEGVTIAGSSLCAGLIQDGVLEIPRELTIRDRLVEFQPGRWRFGGRLDLTLNRGGQKFSLEDIERVVFEQLALPITAVSLRDERLGEELAAAWLNEARLYSTDAADAVGRRIQAVIFEKFGITLPEGHVRPLREWPVNECGKLDRSAVAKTFHQLGAEELIWA